MSSERLDPLRSIQTERDRRWAATVLAVVAGLVLASVHWLGLFVGGALVGLAQPTVRRALLAGIGFGVVVLVVFAVQLAVVGSLDEFVVMERIRLVTVVSSLLVPVIGSLVRGLFQPVSPPGKRQH